MRFAFLIPPLLLVAACGQQDKASDSPEISINAGDKDGGVQITTGEGGGKLKIGGEGVDIDMKIPDFVNLDVGGDFDIDGVKLYPGSHVTTVNVDANDKDGTGKATVQLGFTAPAAPAKAADWMAGEFTKKGVKVTRSGDALTGTGKDGEDFTINFAPDGANAKGDVRIVSK